VDAAAKRLLEEHLPYELDMLEWSFAVLHDVRLEEQRKTQAARNAAVECFWTHARNLYEFMTRKRNRTFQGVASAEDFVDGDFWPDLPFNELDKKMNVQVSHLQYERTQELDGKLGGYDMVRFRDAINRAVARFESQLQHDARSIWKTRTPVVYMPVSDQHSATNVVQMVGSAGPTGPAGPRS
jgi:hypothetical protein